MSKIKDNKPVFPILQKIANTTLKELKTKSKESKMQQYRECVKDKIAKGRLDYMNTEIDISKRDMYSILTELGIDITTKQTNFSSNFIDWYGTDELFIKLKNNTITVGKFVRLVRETVKRNIGVTTLQYKLREKGIVKVELGYTEYELYKKLKEENSQSINLSDEDKKYMLNTYNKEYGLGFLVCEYSIGEIASVIPIALNILCEEIKLLCETNKGIKKWVEFINIWSPRALEYRVSNVDVFNYLLNILDVKEIVKDYNIPSSTVRDYKKRLERDKLYGN